MPALRKAPDPNRAGRKTSRMDVVPDSESIHWTKGEYD